MALIVLGGVVCLAAGAQTAEVQTLPPELKATRPDPQDMPKASLGPGSARKPANKKSPALRSLNEVLKNMPKPGEKKGLSFPVDLAAPKAAAPVLNTNKKPARPAVPVFSSHRLQELLDGGGDSRQLVDAMRTNAGRPTLKEPESSGPALPPEPDGVRYPMPAIYQPQLRDQKNCPNVVFVLIDTLRADKLGCYGDELAVSPRLDALAAQGVRFENVLAQCTWTRPSIGSMLTSRYPREIGIYVEDNQILSDDFTTMAELMRDEGYRTIGLTANPNINTSFNFHQGFDEYVDSGVLFYWMPRTAGQTQLGVSPLPSARELFEKAITLVSQSGNEGPYFLFFDLMEVHEWLSTRPGTSMLRKDYEKLFEGGNDFTRYERMVRQLTDDIGDFVDRLTELPGWEDTIFVFTSDHGEGLGDHPNVHPAVTHGYIVYESVARVPWIIYRKGWKPVRPVISQEVRLLDVMPTLLDMIGAQPAAGAQGVSMLPVINGDKSLVQLPRYEVIESQFQDTDKIAVYGKRFNYIENRKPHVGLSPRELQPRGGHENGTLTNVVQKYPEIASGLKQYMDSWEAKIPRRPPTGASRQMSQQEKEQLEAIGYLDSGPDGPGKKPSAAAGAEEKAKQDDQK